MIQADRGDERSMHTDTRLLYCLVLLHNNQREAQLLQRNRATLSAYCLDMTVVNLQMYKLTYVRYTLTIKLSAVCVLILNDLFSDFEDH